MILVRHLHTFIAMSLGDVGFSIGCDAHNRDGSALDTIIASRFSVVARHHRLVIRDGDNLKASLSAMSPEPSYMWTHVAAWSVLYAYTRWRH